MAVGRECPLRFAGPEKLAALCDKAHHNRGAPVIGRSETGLTFAMGEYFHAWRSPVQSPQLGFCISNMAGKPAILPNAHARLHRETAFTTDYAASHPPICHRDQMKCNSRGPLTHALRTNPQPNSVSASGGRCDEC